MTILDFCISLKIVKSNLVVLGVMDMRQLLITNTDSMSFNFEYCNNPQNNQKDWKRSCQYLNLFSSIFLYYSSNRVPKILFNKEAQQEKFFLNVIFNLDHNVFFHLTPYLLSTNFESVNSFAVILNLKCAPRIFYLKLNQHKKILEI